MTGSKPQATPNPGQAGPAGPAAADLQALADAVAAADWPAAMRRALAFTGRFAEHPLGWQALGIARAAAGDDAAALSAFERAAALAPGDADIACQTAHALKRLHRLPEAEAGYRRVLALHPDHVEALNHLADALFRQGRLAEAEAAFRQSLALRPGDAQTHANLGVMLKNQGKLAAAEAAYRQALALQPGFADALSNLGVLLNRMERRGEAEAAYRQSLAARPGNADTLSNLGLLLMEQGRLAEAEAVCRQALAIDPGLFAARSNLLFMLNHGDGLAPEAALREALEFGRLAAAAAPAPYTAWTCKPQPDRLRVGIVSGDLRGHPVGYFLDAVLDSLTGERIELIAYPTHHVTDALSRRLKAHCIAWRPLLGLSDRAAAELIHADGIHVLLDLSGHTAHNRLPVFAHKPAPLQASWLGYFATTGLAAMDGLIADPVSVPAGQEHHFSEQVWRLPRTRLCFTPPLDAPAVSPLPALARGHVTFGCFQSLAKVGDGVLDAWGAVLAAVPTARLRLQCRQLAEPAAAAALLARLRDRGIDANRVDLHVHAPRAAYLSAHAEVDILLDTFPYPGGTTTCEALWMGLPTVSIAGKRLLARQGASLLAAAGLADWVADDEAAYVAKAVAAAADLPALAALRERLRSQVRASPVFDAPRFAHDLGALIWGRWQGWWAAQSQAAAGPAAGAGHAGVSIASAPRVSGSSNNAGTRNDTAPDPRANAMNAAILYRPEGFDTGRDKLMGRHAASEGFLKGIVRHGQLDRLYCYTTSRDLAGHFHRLVGSFGNQRPVHWLDEADAGSPRAPGALYLPDPSLAAAAWRRRGSGGGSGTGQRQYSITGITHTTASAGAMDWIVGLLSAPVQAWDALICTSSVVHDTVERVLVEQQEYLASRMGATHFTRPQLPVIPLGVDTAAYAASAAQRDAARRELGIGEHDVVVLFVGRLSFHAKAHPLPMYLGLEQAARAWAQQGGRGKVHLVQAGWFANEAIESAFRSGAAMFCPSVVCTFVDGRKPDARQMAWQAADLFTSLSDNFQETFGLTPIEAMAAGLPGVVSDWNGYRDTVRDGIDGLRVPTLMPRAGLGTDLADRHAAGIDSYDVYCGVSSQFVAIAPEAAAAAYLRLISDAALRQRLGAAARQQALAVFDWSVVIARYQALWAELATRRAAGDESAARRPGQPANPSRLDPFVSFASYASDTLSPAHAVTIAPGADAVRLQAWLQSPLLSYMQRAAPDADEIGRLLAELQQRGTLSVADILAGTAEERRGRVERGLVWLAKLGGVMIRPSGR